MPAGDSVAVGDSAAVVVSIVDSGEAAGLDAGATVSVFCSHASRSAAQVRMQSKHFIAENDGFTADSQPEGRLAVRFTTALRTSSRAPRPPRYKLAYRREY